MFISKSRENSLYRLAAKAVFAVYLEFGTQVLVYLPLNAVL
jgi:hypothetical protein